MNGAIEQFGVPGENESPKEIMDVFREAVRADVNTIVPKPWDAMALVHIFADGVSTVVAVKYDGILCTPSSSEKGTNLAYKHHLHIRLREAMEDTERGLFHCWVTLFNQQTNTWRDWFFWKDDENPWIIDDFALDSHFAASQNPVNSQLLRRPFSSQAAFHLYARHIRKTAKRKPFVTFPEMQDDRLLGGYRIYKRHDNRATNQPLESISAANQRSVALVADNLEVEITNSPVEQHQAILDELNARHPVPEPGLWVA